MYIVGHIKACLCWIKNWLFIWLFDQLKDETDDITKQNLAHIFIVLSEQQPVNISLADMSEIIIREDMHVVNSVEMETTLHYPDQDSDWVDCSN